MVFHLGSSLWRMLPHPFDDIASLVALQLFEPLRYQSLGFPFGLVSLADAFASFRRQASLSALRLFEPLRYQSRMSSNAKINRQPQVCKHSWGCLFILALDLYGRAKEAIHTVDSLEIVLLSYIISFVRFQLEGL